MILIVISVVLATVAAVAGWYFVWLYWREPWRELEAGRYLMRFTIGLAVITTWSAGGIILRQILGEREWLEIALAVGRTMIFGWVAVMLIHQARLLRKSIQERKE